MTRYNKEGLTSATEYLLKLIQHGHHKKMELMQITDKAAGTISNQLAWLVNQRKIKRVGVGLYEMQ